MTDRFVALAGIAPVSPTVAGWLRADSSASFGAPLYALLAATAAGMVASCLRWLVLDKILLMTGVTPPVFNTRALEERPGAVNFLIEHHYRFYQFYANTLVAVLWSYSIFRWLRTSSLISFGTDVGVLILCGVLFAGSRDALGKYRDRSRELMGQISLAHAQGEAMTNGVDHHQGKGGAAEKPFEPKSQNKPERPEATKGAHPKQGKG